MRASAAIDDHQGAFWGGHLNAGGVATIANCVSPGSGKRASGSPELDLHTRRINAHSARDRTCQARPLPMLVCGPNSPSYFLLRLSIPFVRAGAQMRESAASPARNQPPNSRRTGRTRFPISHLLTSKLVTASFANAHRLQFGTQKFAAEL